MKTSIWVSLVCVLFLVQFASYNAGATGLVSCQAGEKVNNPGKNQLFNPLVIYFKPSGYHLTTSDSISIVNTISTYKDKSTISFLITASTDPTGNDAINRRLSKQRGNEVKKILINCGIPESRIMVKSSAKAVKGNNPTEDYSKMRKVEITVLMMSK